VSTTLYWMQAGGCGGDTQSLLGIDSPELPDRLRELSVAVLWHPAISTLGPGAQQALLEGLITGAQPLDVLCVEGAIIRGPGGTGMYDTLRGRPRKDVVAGLARRARFVVAVGTCASFGGMGGANDVEACGLQFRRANRGGLLGEGFVSGSGLPVVNLPGCPAHPAVVAETLAALVQGVPLPLDALQMPIEWFGLTVHQGCTRNEYHEYRVEEIDFGERGCLFFHKGCRGPLARGPCNKLLWNRRSSKTRAGVPCFGCTEPGFPQRHPFFETPNVEGLPLELPDGISRAHYLAYKGMAAAAAPDRLRTRKAGI
jgi:hydrogenase small subunit